MIVDKKDGMKLLEKIKAERNLDKLKLDIGSGLNDDESWIKLDDMSDFNEDDLEYWKYVDVKGDGNDLPFEDETFDEVQSTRCIGIYADVYEAIRVLKTGSLLKLNVWTQKLGDVMNQLIETGMVVIEKIEGCNYDDDEGWYDIWIEAKKVGKDEGMMKFE